MPRTRRRPTVLKRSIKSGSRPLTTRPHHLADQSGLQPCHEAYSDFLHVVGLIREVEGLANSRGLANIAKKEREDLWPNQWSLSTPNTPSRPMVSPSATGQVRPLTPIIALHRTLLPMMNPRSVMTRRATQPRRLAPYPSLFKFNYLSKGFLSLLPPPSNECRQDRTEYRIVIFDSASDLSLCVSGHLRLLHDDCSTVYSDMDREGLKLTIIECFPRSFGVGIASWHTCLYLG